MHKYVYYYNTSRVSYVHKYQNGLFYLLLFWISLFSSFLFYIIRFMSNTDNELEKEKNRKEKKKPKKINSKYFIRWITNTIRNKMCNMYVLVYAKSEQRAPIECPKYILFASGFGIWYVMYLEYVIWILPNHLLSFHGCIEYSCAACRSYLNYILCLLFSIYLECVFFLLFFFFNIICLRYQYNTLNTYTSSSYTLWCTFGIYLHTIYLFKQNE